MIYSVASRCSLPELFNLKSLGIFFAGVDPAVKVVQYYGYTKASQRHFCHIMAQDQQITPEHPPFPPIRDAIYLKDFCHHPPPGGVSTRIAMIRSAAQTIHQLWRAGYALDDFSPLLWRFDRIGSTTKLSVPSTLSLRSDPLTLDQLTRRFARWRMETLGQLSNASCRAFMVCFLSWEPLGSGRVATYLEEIERLVQRNQPRFLRDTLDRYAHRHGSPNATAAYLTDLRIPVQPDAPPATSRSAAAWLTDALKRGDNWYAMSATWHDLLRAIERHGFEVIHHPLLHVIQLSQPPDNAGPWHAWIDPAHLAPRTRRWLRRPPSLPDTLEQEIHRLRQNLPAP
jgi:hypothetical protein